MSDESFLSQLLFKPNVVVTSVPFHLGAGAEVVRVNAPRRALASVAEGRPSNMRSGPHVDAPVWPWSLGGWLLATLFVLLFVYSSANR